MQKEFKRIFAVLKNGAIPEIKVAKQELEKLFKGDRKKFIQNAHYALEQLEEFDSIQNPVNQAAFVSSLSLFFFALSDTHFKELKDFVLKVICHSDGHVREQMRKTADWLYISVSSRVRPFMYPKGKKLSEKQIADREKAKNEFAEYLNDIEYLMEKYDDGRYDGFEYIDDMKPSVYKSLQLLWSDVTRGGLQNDLHTPPLTILAKREEIENELLEYIREMKSDITLEEIQDVIYEETEVDDLNDVIRMFDMRSPYELQNVIETLNDAWNYFPHKILDGLCPAEVFSQNQKAKIIN